MAKRKKEEHPQHATVRAYRSRGVDVEIRTSKNRVDLTLDGKPIKVSIVDGQFHSQLANQFTGFDTIDEVVETLLANEGRTWTLHGHVCDENCGDGHHHGGGHGHGHGHEHGGSHGHTPHSSGEHP